MKTFSLLFILCVSVAGFSAQTLQPNQFGIEGASKGVPLYFDAVFTNTRSEPVTLSHYQCTGYGDLSIIQWLFKSDSSAIDSNVVEPGEAIELVFKVVVETPTPLPYMCELEYLDTKRVPRYISYSLYVTPPTVWSVSASSSTIEFGEVEEWTKDTANIVLRNASADSVRVQIWVRPSSTFSIVDSRAWTIKPFDSVSIPTEFYPTGEGIFQDAVQFAPEFAGGKPVLSVRFLGIGVPYDTTTIVAPIPETDYTDIAVGTESVINIQFATKKAEVVVVNASLRHATNFILKPIALPATINPSTPLVVSVGFLPTQPGTFVDTLVVTTNSGATAQVILHGSAVVSGIADYSSTCIAYPNPTTKGVHWCGAALERWRVFTSTGQLIIEVVADEEGNCQWTSDKSGLFFLQNARSKQTLSVLVVH